MGVSPNSSLKCCTNVSLLILALANRRKKKVHRVGYLFLKSLLIKSLLLQHQRRHSLNVLQQKRKRRWWTRPIFAEHDLFSIWFTLIPTMRETDVDKFYNFFRMYPADFDCLLKKVERFLVKKSPRTPICPGERLAITLRYLASGETQTSLSYQFRVSDQAISNIVLETTSVIWSVLRHDVLPSPTEDLWLKNAAEFQVMWNFPHACGAIDGKHVRVRAFPRSGTRDFNYKKEFSLLFMAVADAKQKFVVVESGASGSVGDGGMLIRSVFGKMVERGTIGLPPPCPVDGIDGDLPFMFLGDNAYARTSNFQTPIKGKHLPIPEAMFNYRVSRPRRCVENAFGIMQARWMILEGPIRGSRALVKSVILACIVLHNWHLMNEDSISPLKRRYRPPGYADYIDENGKYVFGRWRQEKPDEERSCLQDLKKKMSDLKEQPETMGGAELSFHGVSFEIEEVTLSDDFIKIHDDSVKLWVKAMQKFIEAAEVIDAENRMKKTMWW